MAQGFQPGNQYATRGKRIPRGAFPFSAKDVARYFLQWKELVTTGEMTPLQRMYATERLVMFMADRLWGKPAQSVAVTADKPLAAVVNITLGSDGNGMPTIPLTPLGQALLMDSKPCLVTENYSSRDLKEPEVLPNLAPDMQMQESSQSLAPDMQMQESSQAGAPADVKKSHLPDWLG